MTSASPCLVLVVPRGEAVRNFLHSSTTSALVPNARVVVLSVVDDRRLLGGLDERIELIPLREHPRPASADYVRSVTENAHDRWLWSAVAQNNWRLRDRRATTLARRTKRVVVKTVARLLANSPALHLLTRLEQRLALGAGAVAEFTALFSKLRPDLVFNCSHIHGLAGELPLRVAHSMGIRTAGFIFSWDNLTSRSRIFVPYDHYLVWHRAMQRQLLRIYPRVDPAAVVVTGTPQFDFHFDPALALSREELCRRIHVDPERPYVLYTTGIANHFYDEHLHVRQVIRLLAESEVRPRPQLVVRTYAKGTSAEMKALAEEEHPGVVFPPVLWEPRWQMPLREDLQIYSNLLRHAAAGINAASTVSLELLMFDKPVINLDFDPLGTDLPWDMGFERHIRFDHYRPLAKSGAVMVARSTDDMRRMIEVALREPQSGERERSRFLVETFGDTLDGAAGLRVAETLLDLATRGGEKGGAS